MRKVSIGRARAQLSDLVQRVQAGESFIITNRGEPVAKLTGVKKRAARKPCRLGFLKGMFLVPDDFDRMGSAEIGELF